MTFVLQHAVYNIPNADTTDDPAVVLGQSDDFPLEAIASLVGATALLPLAPKEASQTQALAYVPHPDIEQEMILALAETVDDASRIHVVLLPPEVVTALNGDVVLLQVLATMPACSDSVTNAPLEPLTVGDTPPTYDRHARLQGLYDILPANDMQTAFALLGAVLHPHPLLIANFAPELEARMALIEGMLALLPTAARHTITFNTHATAFSETVDFQFDAPSPDPAPTSPPTAETPTPQDNTAWPLDWSKLKLDGSLLTNHAYVAYLNSMWGASEQDLDTLTTVLDDTEPYATALLDASTREIGLTHIANRSRADNALKSGDAIATELLLAVLDSPHPPTEQAYTHYIERLLHNVLDHHDAAGAAALVERLDADPDLEAQIQPLIDQALADQPDTAYVIARASLSDQNGSNGSDTHADDDMDPVAEARRQKWLDRLHEAAKNAVNVAIETDEPSIISRWLTLIAREPRAYHLQDVLYNGLVAAMPMASQHEELAMDLLTIAIKRAPDLIPDLLKADGFLSQLPDLLGNALREPATADIEALAEGPREMFLLAVRRGLDNDTPVINAPIIRVLWQLYQGSSVRVGDPFRPSTLIHDIVRLGEGKLVNGGLDALFILILNDNEDALFRELAAELAQQDRLEGLLPRVLQQSHRDDDDKIMLISNLVSGEYLTPQQAVDSYLAILQDRTWEKAEEELVEQLARVLNQNSEIRVDESILWRMIDLAEDIRSELILRVAVPRLLVMLESASIDYDEDFAEQLLRLRKAINWNPSTRATLMSWWRKYTGALSVTQLQQLDKLLDGSRTLEEMRAIVQTHVSLRKVIGTRSLSDFAEQVNTAYKVLEAIADGFDSNTRNLGVDTATIRSVLQSRDDSLSLDEQQVLAINLKELAQLLTTMAANRSKPSLIRSDEAVDRGLARGEQAPQSALDVMKWLAGYLDGAQPSENEDS